MQLGRHLNELFRHRLGLAICLALATLAALTISYKVSLLPPGLQPRSLEMAAAKTEMLVDGPLATVLDLRQGASDIEGMTNRAVLIGNVMVSAPVLGFIGRRAGVAPQAIRGQAPLTPDFPRPFTGVGQNPKTEDLLRATDQYRLNVQTDPSVPIIEVFAQAPTTDAAAALANASVDGLRDYLALVATRRRTPPKDQVRLTQLGRATGTVINGGVRPQLAVLSFLIVFALSAATVVFAGRVRRGWRHAVDDEHAGDGPAGPAPFAAGAHDDGTANAPDASYVSL
jgi:hypothetical protein